MDFIGLLLENKVSPRAEDARDLGLHSLTCVEESAHCVN